MASMLAPSFTKTTDALNAKPQLEAFAQPHAANAG
ncbi:hypothetical protein ACVIW0_006396 [Bradyrhizobium sp. USDA 4454]